MLASVEGEVAYPNGAYDESTGKLTVSYYRYADEEWILENREVNEEGKVLEKIQVHKNHGCEISAGNPCGNRR